MGYKEMKTKITTVRVMYTRTVRVFAIPLLLLQLLLLLLLAFSNQREREREQNFKSGFDQSGSGECMWSYA